MSALAPVHSPTNQQMASFENALIQGDLKDLTPAQRISYYRQVCESVGLNPLTKPFSYLSLSGKTVLYANRDCTDQLRKVNKVSIKIVSRETIEGVYVVTASATDKEARQDESTGAVNIKGLSGEGLANAFMKAETKAKRRVTLSICGLGMLDETEVQTIPGAVQLDDGEDKPLAPALPDKGADKPQQIDSKASFEIATRMIEAIHSEAFTRDKAGLWQSMKSDHETKLTATDKQRVSAEWNLRSNATIDPAKSAAMRDTIVKSINASETLADVDATGLVLRSNKDKLTSDDWKIVVEAGKLRRDIIQQEAAIRAEHGPGSTEP